MASRSALSAAGRLGCSGTRSGAHIVQRVRCLASTSRQPQPQQQQQQPQSKQQRSLEKAQAAARAKAKDQWDILHRTQYNVDPFTLEPEPEHLSYPLVTAATLSKRGRDSSRPTGVRMLARDFIDDSLYHPTYGYFSRHAVLLPDALTADALQGQGYDFNKLANDKAFGDAVQRRYEAFEASLPPLEPEAESAETKPVRKYRVGSAEHMEDAMRRGRESLARQQRAEAAQEHGQHDENVRVMAARQVWHTPTELFKPHYAHAIARYLCAEYKLNLYPYDDLVIYELGAGSGALAEDVLNYLQHHEPEIYSRTRYNIVEISERLSKQQAKRLSDHMQSGTVTIRNKSILEWDQDVLEPCFVVALEVLDNLAHDIVRYSTANLQPYQCSISIDKTGDMHELWEPVKDPLIKRYLELSQSARGTTFPPSAPRYLRYLPDSVKRILEAHFPLYPNLTPPHFLPTGSLRLLDVLRSRFPLHRLIAADFNELPAALQGVDGPVVQTRLSGTMVPVSTFRVLQGFFDIFFPTNFAVLRDVYARVMSAPPVDSSPPPVGIPVLGRPSPSSHEVEAGNSRPSPLSTSSSFRPDYFSASNNVGVLRAGGGGTSRRDRVRIYTHAEFLERYADVDKTRLRDGSNPMLSWYQNASWLLS